MKKWWSHILLFALLVISPISFTTAEIPSVYIAVTINAPPEESPKNCITVAHRVAKTVQPSAVVNFSPESTKRQLTPLLAISSNHEIEHGRAPPATTSV